MSPVSPAWVMQQLHACPLCPGLFPSRQTLADHLVDHALLVEHTLSADSPHSSTMQSAGDGAPPVIASRPREALQQTEPDRLVTSSSSSPALAKTPSNETHSIVLEEIISPNYEPTNAELHEYADWLGMDMEADRHLLWIAKDALKAPLQASWKACRTIETQELYYFNFATGQSTWDHPGDAVYRQMNQDHKAAEAAAAPSALVGQGENDDCTRQRHRYTRFGKS